MNRTSLLIAGAGLLLLVAVMVIFSAWFADFPAVQATLIVRTGSATVTHADGQSESVAADHQMPIKPNETIQADGLSTLALAGAQTDLSTGTQIQLTHYGASGAEAQVEILLKAGQTWQRIAGYGDNRSSYRLRTADGATINMRTGEGLAYLGSQGLLFGLASGSAGVNAQGHSVTVNQGQGTAVAPGQPPADPGPWSRGRVLTYRPDGSTVSLPAALINAQTGDQFRMISMQSFAVPPGIYRLTVDTLETYQADKLPLTADTFNELPVTLSEIVFTTSDSAGATVGYSGLRIQGVSEARAVPERGILISPGKWMLIVAREEKLSATQPVNVVVAPGQRLNVVLRNDLFGGGSVEVHVIGPKGSPWQPVTVEVYAPGSESGQPILTFKSDTAPQPLPAGSYAITVKTPIADRFEIPVKQNQITPVQVQLGSITVNYADTQSRPVNQIVYIASADDMKRLGLSVDQMRQTPYGIAVGTGQMVLVPQGTYNVQVGDHNATGQSGVRVDAGQTVTLNLQGTS